MLQRSSIPFLPFQYHFEHKFSSQDTQIKNKVENFIRLIENALKSRKDFDKVICGYLNETFDIRMFTLKWLVQKKLNLGDLKNALVDFENDVLKARKSKAFSDLAQNISFAIRTHQRVMSKLIQATTEGQELENSKVPSFNYDEFLTVLYLSNIPSNEYDKIVGWINASLLMEFGLLTCLIILEEDLEGSESKINQISKSIAKNAQKYGSYAIQMGLVSERKNFLLNQFLAPELVINEEKQLAETGIVEFAQSL